MAEELAYKRKARLRGKNRKVRIAQVYDFGNLRVADHEARRGKEAHKGVRIFDRDAEGNLQSLQQQLMTGTITPRLAMSAYVIVRVAKTDCCISCRTIQTT